MSGSESFVTLAFALVFSRDIDKQTKNRKENSYSYDFLFSSVNSVKDWDDLKKGASLPVI